MAANHRWSMPWDERCRCLGVVAPEENNPPQSCPLVPGDISQSSAYWFTDDKKKLTTRCNWKPDILNELLDRAEYCRSEYSISSPNGPVTLCRIDLTYNTKNECYSSIFVLCSFYILLLTAICVRASRCLLQIVSCEASFFCRTGDFANG